MDISLTYTSLGVLLTQDDKNKGTEIDVTQIDVPLSILLIQANREAEKLLFTDYAPFDDVLEDFSSIPKNDPIKAYAKVETFAKRYAKLINICKQLHNLACKNIGYKFEFGAFLPIAFYGKPIEEEKYIHIMREAFEIETFGSDFYEFAIRICAYQALYKKQAEDYIERQKQERHAQKEAEALLASIEVASRTSTSDAPKDANPTDSKKQTIISRATALYILIKKLQGAGIISKDIDQTAIARFIAAVIGENKTKPIVNTTAYDVAKVWGEVNDKAKSEAKEYLKLLKIGD
ncbi:MAG: hypothetical protein K2N21_01960 [Rikenellaceae bacterium]|nr:hypothetical protein [Rikenellaceae bacterium]